jgi:hypothetical protein
LLQEVFLSIALIMPTLSPISCLSFSMSLSGGIFVTSCAQKCLLACMRLSSERIQEVGQRKCFKPVAPNDTLEGFYVRGVGDERQTVFERDCL